MYCTNCGEENPQNSKFCQRCGSQLEKKQAPPIPQPAPETPPQTETFTQEPYQPTYDRPPKDRMVAGILALLLGGLGVHKFYLENIGAGLLYLCFCWTGIPEIIGFIEGIIYLTESDEEFQRNHAYPPVNNGF
ncbi:MAG: NINE protein [Promethearchaeota archaeon]